MIMIKIAGLRRREPLRLMKVGEGGGGEDRDVGRGEGEGSGAGVSQGVCFPGVWAEVSSFLRTGGSSIIAGGAQTSGPAGLHPRRP